MMQRSMTDEQLLTVYGYDKEPWLWPNGKRASKQYEPDDVFVPRPECIPSHFHVYLTSSKNNRGGRTWVGVALDWDDACVRAEAANPGWDPHTVGLDVNNPRPPVNPILSAFRNEWAAYPDGSIAKEAVLDQWADGLDGTVAAQSCSPEQVEFAREVLTRIARIYGGTE